MTNRRVLAAVAVAVALGMAGCSQSPSGGTDSRPATSTPTPSASTSPPVPSQDEWLADVRTAMRGSLNLLDRRVADRAKGQRLAVNLDIDNTSVASYYDPGVALPEVLELAREADRRGVAVLFNTGRTAADGGRSKVTRLLREAGYPVTELCLRRDGEDLVVGKKRCRRHFRAEGYTLIANVGNNPTDFIGGRYGHAYRLPSYDGALS